VRLVFSIENSTKRENLQKGVEKRNYKYFFKEKITSRSPLRFLGKCAVGI